MANDEERLIVSLEARINQFEKNMQRANQVAGNNFRRMQSDAKRAATAMQREMEKASSSVAKSMQRFGSGFGGGIGSNMPMLNNLKIGYAAAGAAAAAMVAKTVQAGDRWNQIGNRLKTAGVAAGDVANEQQRIADMSMRAHSSLEATTDLYVKMLGVTKQMGLPNQSAADATEAVAKALSLAGVSAEAAKGSITQLGQALGSGVLRGDEFNSLMESLGTSSPLIKAIAAEFGIATTQLRAFAADGKLSSERVFKALVAAKPEIDNLAKSSIPSLSQAWTDLDTATTHAAASIAQGTGAAGGLAKAMNAVAQAINNAATAYDTWSRKSFNPTLADDLQKAQGMVNSLELKLKNRIERGESKESIQYIQTQLDMWKVILSTMQQTSKVQEKITADQKAAADTKRDLESKQPGKTDAEVVDEWRKGQGVGMDDKAKFISKATDDIIAALKKAGSKLSDAAMQDYARNEAEKAYNQREGDKLSSEGVSAATKSYVDRVIKAESGGKANAKNPNSSATGVGQFIASTWLDLFRRYYPQQAANMGRDAILALRKDAEVSKRLIEAYAEENAKALQKAGVAVTEANLHLSHFLGVGDAIKVLKAAPGTKLAGLVSSASIKANPTILGGGRTVDDAIAYANRRAGATRVAAGDLTPQEKSKKDYDEIVAGARESTEAVNRENAALHQNAYESDYAAEKARLLAEAKSKGIELTPQVVAGLEAEARAHAKAKQSGEDERKSLEKINERRDWLAGELNSTFTSIITGSSSASEALQRLAQSFAEAAIQAALLNSGPLAGIWGSSTGKGGILGNIVGMIPGFAEGGRITGPGGSRDDKIMAMVSNGEFIVNAAATKRYGALLHALNSGSVPRFADGGIVGNAGGSQPFKPISSKAPGLNVGGISVSVTGAPGSTGDAGKDQENHKNLGKQVAAAIDQAMSDWTHNQMRPGGVLAR